uniref:Uncharacterized protein LOC105040991 isoform X2 n=1 Tax=Elaeis guineensis var. tenera TaxID=51953 RepID=A0A8N4IDQ5_ELAGV|nr:uncharacterized protein LOC105040991 isoform X2 [Elaeis guineensis]
MDLTQQSCIQPGSIHNSAMDGHELWADPVSPKLSWIIGRSAPRKGILYLSPVSPFRPSATPTMAMVAGSYAAAAVVPISRGRSLARAAQRLLACPLLLLTREPFPLATLTRSPSRGICQIAHALKPGADSLLQGVGDKNVAEAVKNILDMARRASSRREILHTDFLPPPAVKESMSALEKLSDIRAVAQGGYPQAERCRISVGHSDAMTTDPDVVAALSISGNFGFEACSHGDFLGAILGTGIVREKVGDILLQGEKGAQVLVVPELTEFLISALDKVRNVPVTCKQIPLLALEYEPPSAGDVRVNWSPVIKNGTVLKTGDIVSINGKGRLKIGEITTTRKGKYAVELIRYL